jgi:cell fate regulator YaaT (PSP1 superfamily)
MVMAVTFTRFGRLYYLDPGVLTPRVGDKVLVPTHDGPEVAEVVWPPTWVSEDIGGLPVCAGLADAAALARDERNRKRKAEAKVAAKRLVRKHDLPMKVVAVDYVDTRADVDELMVVYFSAPHRVDFRDLVRELAREVRARIDLRQIGARDEARVQGGLGPCGRDTCCSTFLTDFEPVSIRMAKDQDLPLNPLKISGACGRLMCCLKYEHPLYLDFKAEAPPLGSTVTVLPADGEPGPSGTVVGYNVPGDTVLVRDAETGRRTACPRASVCGSRQAYEAAHAGGVPGTQAAAVPHQAPGEVPAQATDDAAVTG